LKPRPVRSRSLSAVLLDLAERTGTEIASVEPGLAAVQVMPPVPTGSTEQMLSRMLRGTSYRAVQAGPRSYRIVRVASPLPRPKRQTAPPLPLRSADIVVTASKQRIPLDRFPGTITTLAPDSAVLGPAAGRDMTAIASATPVLQTTALGSGRDKIFIRGIADSSFNGATQSATSYYFGDVQLGYSTPEPALALVDMQSVEIMEGPQGTLYGAGAIGGVVRMVPNPVDLNRTGGTVSTALAATERGGAGDAVTATLNLPVAAGAGVRLVGYQSRDGGYIDARSPPRQNINGVTRLGGRVATRYDPGNGWTLDASALAQRIAADDGQYADRLSGALIRDSRLSQPYRNSLALGRLLVTKHWGSGLELVSASSISHYAAVDAFDASRRPPAPLIQYRDHRSNRLITQEARLSRSLSHGASWVVGIAALNNRDAQDRTFGPVTNPTDIIAVTNVSSSQSAFVELTEPLFAKLFVTGGLRATFSHVDGTPSVKPRAGDIVRGRQTHRADPTIAIAWEVTPRVSLYARYQSGFRTGGLAVARGIGRVAEFATDDIGMGEVGLRTTRHGATGLTLSTALSYARWTDIQADLVDRSGQPYTANIGDAQIFAAELNADWIPVAGLTLKAAALYTDNRVSGTIADTAPPGDRRLPDTPPFAAHGRLEYGWSIGRDRLRVAGSVEYVGRSVLGVGNFLDIAQGHYASGSAELGWRRGAVDLSLTVENLTDTHANRFAFGNPFSLANREQVTPMRPRTARIGAAISF
jgi:outer membrane receptor protein involved in Fe transport